jgi:hypothetical protein
MIDDLHDIHVGVQHHVPSGCPRLLFDATLRLQYKYDKEKRTGPYAKASKLAIF